MTFIQGHSYIRNEELSFKVTVVWEMKNFSVHFLRNIAIDLDEIECVTTTCWSVKAHSKFILYK